MREKPIKLASKLKLIRQRLGLSQTEMVHRMKFRGHYGRISEYELGKRQPSVVTL
jgi:transcriptional regulator with XRE-family HTH domain